jgi:hypothetical protein
MVRFGLELFGGRIDSHYRALARKGRAYREFAELALESEMYLMQIRADRAGTWVARGVISGGGPIISERRAYDIDVSDLPGDRLRLKLTPAAHCWRIDAIAVDYGQEAPFAVHEISSTSAATETGADVLRTLAAEDGDYHVMPDVGDHLELVFPAPADGGMRRTAFLEVSGYYDINLRRRGVPNYSLLARLRRTSDPLLEYSVRAHARRTPFARTFP